MDKNIEFSSVQLLLGNHVRGGPPVHHPSGYFFYFSVSSTVVFCLVYAIFLGRILLRSESNPFQVVIMLSTGTPTWTQGISLVSSVLSLSWGASRTFMMLRPSDKADADPELITVSLRIWPYVLEQFGSKSINMRNLDVSYVRSFLLN